MPDEKSFLDWNPVLTPEQVYANTIGINYPTVAPDGELYWLESRASEKGRITLVKLEGEETLDMTPAYNIRSQVHEYGGKAFHIGAKFIYFVNFMDQRIYKQDIKDINKVVPLTPEKYADESVGKFMDLVALPDESKLLFVYEQEFSDHSKPKNCIGWIDLTKTEIQEPSIIVEGNDFYAELQIANDGSFCCWLTWNLPYMPWDFTELWKATITEKGLIDQTKIAGGLGESIISPVISPTNEIFFSMDFPNKNEKDFENYWNIYRYNEVLHKIFPVTKEFVEFGRPLWNSGYRNYVFLTNNNLLCLYRKNGKTNLALLELDKLKLTKIHTEYTNINFVATREKTVYLQGSNAMNPPLLTSFAFKGKKLEKEKIILKSMPDEFLLPKENISVGKLISFPTKDGEKSYGYLYLPKNSEYKADVKEKPPLLVLVHGGPTQNSDSFYSNYLQFWTTSGFAIFDVEYRGSTGFGRRYRDKLLGNWGEIEISDIEDAINYLLEKKVISKKIAITGGSAGGYTVQRALTKLPDLFQVGGSHYGIGNLETLLKLMHKFESKYLDLMIGDDMELIRDRSPINHLENLKAPMIIFQGADDKVVPPAVSREMAEILEEKGIKSDYIEYTGEGHGFRQLDHKVDALTKESAFFKEVLREE